MTSKFDQVLDRPKNDATFGVGRNKCSAQIRQHEQSRAMDGEDLSADALSRLWRARKTLAQMLADREYMVLEEDQALTFDDFKERFGVGSGLR